MTDRAQSSLVRGWLLLLAVSIVAIVLVGGATRLTGSGLSITEWRPVTGTLPPMDAVDWQTEFDKYQDSPQFRLENAHFTMEEFKAIYWWEWAHRLLGRLIGLLALAPALVFWRRGMLPRWLGRRSAVIVVLIGFQGALGWFMVASGLVDEPRVGHLRLAAHLLTALFALGVVLWTWAEATHGRRRVGGTPEARSVLWLGAALVLQIAYGAFVAGLRAGLYFPTWPRMGARWFPDLSEHTGSTLAAFVTNPLAVQFVHRWLGAVVVLAAIVVAIRLARRTGLRRYAVLLPLLTAAQFALGIWTILRFYLHPVTLGVAHQLGAVILLSATVLACFAASRVPADADVAAGIRD